MAPWEIILSPSGLADIVNLPLEVQFRIRGLTNRLRRDPGLIDPALRTHNGPWTHRMGPWDVRLWVDANACEIHVLNVTRR